MYSRLQLNRMHELGHIQLILGPMFSGKSSQMQRKVRRYQHARKKCLVVNYERDNRYTCEDVSSTHDLITIKAIKTANLTQILPRALKHDVVAIDEGQFFPDITEIAEKLANSGVVVIIAALDGTFQRKPFGNILSLVPMAEIVTKLSAVCIDCGKEAAFTRRTIDSQEIELIGGQEVYKPVCRGCFGLSSLKQSEKEITLSEGLISLQNLNVSVKSE